MNKTENRKMLKGDMKLRRYTRFGNDYKKMATKAEECEDDNVAFVLDHWDGTSRSLMKKIKTIEGASANLDLTTFGFTSKKTPTQSKKKDGSKKKKVVKKKDGAKKKGKPKIRLIEPEIVGCPETDDKGNEVFLTATKDGRFGCATLNFDE